MLLAPIILIPGTLLNPVAGSLLAMRAVWRNRLEQAQVSA